ncbi:hypothetical protein ONS95_010479 [Cadophora gregata]|nr:uncharacterized protein ONS95_010479 [Cadophora gregata]KAK0122225.1 hypothetical protein ONS95_010479 [Cadophora gregata]
MNSLARQQKQAAFLASTPAQQQRTVDWDYIHRCERCSALHKVCTGGKPCHRCNTARVECIGFRSGHMFPDSLSESEGDDKYGNDDDGDDTGDAGDGADQSDGDDGGDDGDAGSGGEIDEELEQQTESGEEDGEQEANHSIEEENGETGQIDVEEEAPEVVDDYPYGTIGWYRHEQTSLARYIRSLWDRMPEDQRRERVNSACLEFRP